MATATAEFGVCSPEVKTLQQNLNKVMKQCRVKATGTFDEETAAAVAQFQAEAGLPQSGKLDAATAKAMQEALIPRTEVTYQGKTYWLTKEEYASLTAKLAADVRSGSSSAQQYLSMCQEVRILWNAHKEARENNQVFAWIIEGASGANFPSEGMITAAEACAQKIQSAAGNPKALNAALQNTAPIRTAFAAMDQYREELFGGGEELVRQLETIRDGCVIILEISAALATGGASWTVQVGVAAGVGSYKALLGEIDKGSRHDSKQTVSSAISDVIVGGAIEGAVAIIMKGPKSKAVIEYVAKTAAIEGQWPNHQRMRPQVARQVRRARHRRRIQEGLRGVCERPAQGLQSERQDDARRSGRQDRRKLRQGRALAAARQHTRQIRRKATPARCSARPTSREWATSSWTKR